MLKISQYLLLSLFTTNSVFSMNEADLKQHEADRLGRIRQSMESILPKLENTDVEFEYAEVMLTPRSSAKMKKGFHQMIDYYQLFRDGGDFDGYYKGKKTYGIVFHDPLRIGFDLYGDNSQDDIFKCKFIETYRENKQEDIDAFANKCVKDITKKLYLLNYEDLPNKRQKEIFEKHFCLLKKTDKENFTRKDALFLAKYKIILDIFIKDCKLPSIWETMYEKLKGETIEDFTSRAINSIFRDDLYQNAASQYDEEDIYNETEEKPENKFIKIEKSNLKNPTSYLENSERKYRESEPIKTEIKKEIIKDTRKVTAFGGTAKIEEPTRFVYQRTNKPDLNKSTKTRNSLF